ncbi:MAG: UDP-N-acetylmuramate dehydrogenase, partial [Oscillospiraceae bacterium]|nr:UDP-N-acetylmuramate dehydrogenase [Oscillospiraceae bacterium]
YLGNGSNVLVKDNGYRGIIINFSKLNKISLDGNFIIAQSGAQLKDVSSFALEHSLTGLEFACGIPGTVGGASAMNAGAYDGETKNVIDNILMVNGNDEIRRVYVDEIGFGYRKSILLQENYAALEVCYKLKPGIYENIKKRIDQLTMWRTEKQPLEYPSAGSTFKRPEGYFTGKLIQDAGLKGFSLGGAQVSPKHAGFVINSNKATAQEVIDLIAYIKMSIMEKYNVELSPEVRIIGE